MPCDFFYKHECHCGDADLVELKLDFVFLWRLGEGQRGNAGSTDLGSKPSEWGWTVWRSPVMWGISQRYWAHWELRVRTRSRNKRPNTCFNQGKGTVMLYIPGDIDGWTAYAIIFIWKMMMPSYQKPESDFSVSFPPRSGSREKGRVHQLPSAKRQRGA